MKTKRTICLCATIGTLLFSPAFASESAPPSAPPLAIEKVLPLAQKFLQERKPDLSGQYIASISLQYDAAAKTRYWLVQWRHVLPRLGMEYGLRVGMDGKVAEQMTGP